MLKFTIGVPVYRVENVIERCAISLFEQTYKNIEIIFLDDCSPDKSIEKLEHILTKYPDMKSKVIILRHAVNKGLAVARNTIVEKATGDYLLWLDSDDYVDKELVEKCVIKQKELESDIILFDLMVINKYGKKVLHHPHCPSSHERTLQLLSRKVPVSLCGGAYRLSLYKNNRITAIEGVNNNEDYQVSPRLSYYSKSVAYIDEPLYFYDCTNEFSITNNFDVEYAKQGWRAISILTSFFNDKGSDYMEAIKVAAINRIAVYLKLSVQNGNRAYYIEMRKMQKEYGMSYAYTIPLGYRIFLYIHSFAILSWLLKIGLIFKKITCYEKNW